MTALMNRDGENEEGWAIGGDEKIQETKKGNESMSEQMPKIRNSVPNLNYDVVNKY